MTKSQILFAIVTGVIGLTGLAWTIYWALRSWRQSGPMISVQLAVGDIYDQQDQLIVTFPNGNKRNMHVEKVNPERASRRKKGTPNPRSNTREPVNAVFVHNRGRGAVTIRRCEYLLPFLQFEPQRAASRWGDLLPKRLESGDEAVLIHERTQMRVFLNGVMRDHGAKNMPLLVVVTLGSGHEVSANIPLVINADMTDEEFAAVSKNFDKEIRDEPPSEFLDVPKGRQMPWQRKSKKTLIARNYAED